MKKWKGKFDPTTEELTGRVVNILATAAVRLATEEEKKADELVTSATPTSQQGFFRLPKRGPVPFGEKLSANGLEIDENEMALIKKIQELAKQGWSSEKIAKQLNEEDYHAKRASKWTRTAVWRILKKGVTR